MTELQNKFSVFSQTPDCEVCFDEPLKKHCTFRIGGNAEILIVPKTEAVLSAVVRFAAENTCPLHVLGNGSNVLISDDGLRGITVKLINGLTGLRLCDDGLIFCEAGVPLKRLCTFALENSLTGLEFAYGIPGSAGGALYMNAGAYGGEIRSVLHSVRSIDPVTGEAEDTPLPALIYEYRNTSFMKNGRIITGAYFRLTPGDKSAIEEQMETLMSKRKASQPLEFPSAGSTFKRPAVGYAAAHIDECGLKGTTVGGAAVSTKHAGFVINTGSATFDDVTGLMELIRKTVYEKHGVLLEPEVEILKD